MCLLPRAVLERVGLPLPLFIKWDDVEYGLRAREHGVPVVTLPGAAVWHMPWTVKDTSRDWQAFYLARNRLVAAALHGGRWPLGVLLHLAAQTLGHLVSMAYSAAELTQAGVEEFARGPRRLHETQREGPALPHRLRAGYVDADAAAAASVRPVAGDTPRAVGRTGGRGVVTGARAVARALLGATGAADTEHQPLTRLPLADARWSVLYRLDRVLVTSLDGRPSSLRVRDRALARRLAARTGRNVVRVLLAWPRLRRQYRRALPELSSPAGWAHLLPPGPT
jgi:galactofuranosylgalactofuranosylrhamnosyl-N-acetylglucosaminyl-diphospho-decaprenol beta-1,5/1,6-galactofuranosyltransferase